MSSKKKTASSKVQTAPETAVPSGGEIVAVACNMPSGVEFPLPDGRSVVLNGNAVHLRGQEMGALPVGAYGITMVKKDDWEQIEKTYGNMAIFKNGLVFAQKKKDDAEAQAAEQAETRHGFEPVDPERTATKPAKTEG